MCSYRSLHNLHRQSAPYGEFGYSCATAAVKCCVSLSCSAASRNLLLINNTLQPHSSFSSTRPREISSCARRAAPMLRGHTRIGSVKSGSTVILQQGPAYCRRHRSTSRIRLQAKERCRPRLTLCSAAGASGASAGQTGDEIPKEGFVSRLLRPLKDFGFGSKSFWEGGVGIFIFAGVGKVSSACTA